MTRVFASSQHFWNFVVGQVIKIVFSKVLVAHETDQFNSEIIFNRVINKNVLVSYHKTPYNDTGQ